ncbi:MAG: deoxyribodipyrimidine photo-lyase, partial [Geminicoccaceae bacterium]
MLPLYIAEPGLWLRPDASGRQFAFLRESLVELREQLSRIGQPLVVRVGEAIPCLDQLHRKLGLATLWSHEETGNGWTYERDLAVASWCRRQGVIWHEIPQFGVIRRLRSRHGWARRWDSFMAKPISPAPTSLMRISNIAPGRIPDARDVGLTPDPCPERFPGGRLAGLAELKSFLHERGEPYQKAMSSPRTALDGCSRLSPHLAFGSVSMRETFQAARHRQ